MEDCDFDIRPPAPDKTRSPAHSGPVSEDAREPRPDYHAKWTAEYIISNRSPEPIPHKLILNVSDCCNFSCGMCAFRPGRLKLRMTPDDWKALVTETYRSGAVYTLFGGEPLLYEDIDGLVRHIGGLNAPMTIVTNGYYLDEHLETLLDNKCQIVLSIDGLEETHDAVRGFHGSFRKIETALSGIARRYPKEYRRLICVNSVLLPENAEKAGDLIDYLYGIGVATVTFQHLQFYGEEERGDTDRLWRDYLGQGFGVLLRPRGQYRFDEAALEKIQASVAEILRKRKLYPDMAIWIYPDLSPKEVPLYYSADHRRLSGRSMCLNPWTCASVSTDGRISLCLDADVGNFKEQGFWSAWYGGRAREFRDFVLQRPFPVCTRCCNFYNSYIPG